MEDFYRVYISSSKHGGLGEFETVIQTRDVVESLHNCREFFQLPECLDEIICKHRKTASIAFIKYFTEIIEGKCCLFTS